MTHPGYGEAVFHIRRIAGRPRGPLKGKPPNFGNRSVLTDTWEDGERTEENVDLEEFALFPGFRLVKPLDGK